MRLIVALVVCFLTGVGFAHADETSNGAKANSALFSLAQKIETIVSMQDYINAAREIDRYWAFFQADEALSKKIADISTRIDPKVRGILSAMDYVQSMSGKSMEGRIVIFIEEADFSRLKENDADLSPALSSALEHKDTAVVIIFSAGEKDNFSESVFLKGERPQGYLKFSCDSKKGKRVAIENKPADYERLNRIFYEINVSHGDVQTDKGQPVKSYRILGAKWAE